MLASRLFPRRLSRSSTWRHISGARIPRTSFSAQHRAYHNPSFAPRPNTLIARIWYRKDGAPRSKMKGVLFGFSVAFLPWFAFKVFKARKLIEVEKKTLVMLLRTQPLVLSFPSADLSTPRSALEYLRDFCITASNKGGHGRWHLPYEKFIEQVGSGNLSPESVEKIHEMAKGAGKTLHSAFLLFQSRDAEVIDMLQIVASVLGNHTIMIQEVIHNDSHTMEAIRQESESRDVVE